MQQLLSETEKRMKETLPIQQSKGKKILIQEVEEEEDESNDEPKAGQTCEICLQFASKINNGFTHTHTHTHAIA